MPCKALAARIHQMAANVRAKIERFLDPTIAHEAAQAHDIWVRIRLIAGNAGFIVPIFLAPCHLTLLQSQACQSRFSVSGRSSTTKSSGTIDATTAGDQHEIISMLPGTGKPP